MNRRALPANRKTHITFAAIFLSVVTLYVATGLIAGQTISAATWGAVSVMKPMDYLMFAVFWYACEMRHKEDWHSPLVTLNLKRTKN